MKIVNFFSEVDPQKCNGDKRCESLCPSGAIKVSDKIAAVNESRCVACGKCFETCREDAIRMVRRPEPRVIAFDVESVDQTSIQTLCEKVSFLPDMSICPCTGTTAKEVAAAIIDGACSPEEIIVKTGAGSGCGIYCMGIIFQFFRAAGVEMPDDPRWKYLPLTPGDIPDEIAEKYPEYYLRSSI